MKRPIIGILTWREGRKFAEPVYFRKMIQAGDELGCTVFLFSPADVLANGKQVRGFLPTKKGWQPRMFPRPDAVIDRYRYSPGPAFKQYVAFRKASDFLYANNRLANKWKVHEVLWKDTKMHPWLPETVLYNQVNLERMLRRHAMIYVKPVNGTGGRNILSVEKKMNGYQLLGRDAQRSRVSTQLGQLASVQNKVKKWATRDRYIVQQGLHLDLVPDRAVDMRLLIQKDGEGQWRITGAGMRVGGAKSATSNLHGGGKAVLARTFLTRHFGEQRTAAILADCERLAFQTVETIENHFGRMMEMGLDIGIDVEGNAWLIEVNPKPGREIFREMGQSRQYKEAIQRPIQYAMFLAGFPFAPKTAGTTDKAAR
ncbi:YheC/YheD family protein [Brevibacillus ruminantium]|uniref:YheC/YheD family protein n=1 Tax=Brevibacillus ruminantium TaxID=2950604 RepID=A0ABY4W946_9BACL|nr:YheC/YheD family protein [Brevibacillus ruminantium]USG63444.1 YheC/YheD family protein [Brevibacillus ruminantium]